MSATSWWTALSSTFVARLCFGGPPKASPAHPPSNIWRRCGKRSMRLVLSVPWALTRWLSPQCIARTLRTRSSPGSTSSADTYTATTTGATTVRRGRAGRAGTGSALCVEPKGRTCRCGWAAKRGFMSTRPRPLTPLTPAAMFVQRRRQPTGVRSRCRTALTPSTPPALSVPTS